MVINAENSSKFFLIISRSSTVVAKVIRVVMDTSSNDEWRIDEEKDVMTVH
jgi:hypothetical protein